MSKDPSTEDVLLALLSATEAPGHASGLAGWGRHEVEALTDALQALRDVRDMSRMIRAASVGVICQHEDARSLECAVINPDLDILLCCHVCVVGYLSADVVWLRDAEVSRG